MKIIQPPNSYDMNHYRYGKEFEKSCDCPFCNNKYYDEFNGPFEIITYIARYKDSIKEERLIEKVYNFFVTRWRYTILRFHCHKCGAIWESNPIKVMIEET